MRRIELVASCQLARRIDILGNMLEIVPAPRMIVLRCGRGSSPVYLLVQSSAAAPFLSPGIVWCPAGACLQAIAPGSPHATHEKTEIRDRDRKPRDGKTVSESQIGSARVATDVPIESRDSIRGTGGSRITASRPPRTRKAGIAKLILASC